MDMKNVRQQLRLDRDWRFHPGDVPYEGDYWAWLKAGTCYQGGSRSRLDDSKWERVDLPHDFVLNAGFVEPDTSKAKPHGFPELWPFTTQDIEINHGFMPRGIGWYRKSFDIPAEDAGRAIYLVFDGVYRNSRTFLNDFYVGDHMSGYTGFTYDVTDLINYGGANLLAMRVDASEPEGWWYEGGGIYRHAWLLKTSPVHVRPDGLFAWSDFDPKKPSMADVHVRIETRNRSDIAADCEVAVKLFGPDGAVEGSAAGEVSVALRQDATCEFAVKIANPKVWSLRQPHLYRAEAELRCGGEMVDKLSVPFGIRHAEFDPDKGFLLNGEPVKIKGMCCHQDHAGVGVAVPDSLQEYRIRRLKDMGCNAYRTAHNPPTPELMDVCDRLGMLVMAEARCFGSTDEHLAQLERLVRVHRNHPSVVLWSIGNEEQQAHTMPQGVRTARTMRHVLRQCDHTRPVTMAIAPYSWFIKDATPLEPLLPLSDELDVMGFNYCECHWLTYHNVRPRRPIVVSEDTSCGVTRGCYRPDPVRRHHAELGLDGPNEQAVINQKHWQLVAENQCLSGIFVWTGFDYRGEPCPYSEWPAVIGNFGTMDLCGFPKDLFYYYKAQWTNEPVLHVFPHWNFPDMVGGKVPVYCHTNCDEVELIVNGESAGRQKVERGSHLAWPNVIYRPGFIEAVGYRAGKEAARRRVETTGDPAAIRLNPNRNSIRGDGMDVAVINVSIEDNRGRLVPTASNEIFFAVEGAGRFLGAGNGDPCSHELDNVPRRKAFAGLCQLIVQAGDAPGILAVTARSAGLPSCDLRLKVS